MDNSISILKKGTVVQYKGIPCELLEDVRIYSETIKVVEENEKTIICSSTS